MLTRLTSREWFRGLSNEAKDALTFGFLLTPRLGLAMASNILTQSDTSGRGAVSIQASVSVATSLAGTERESTSISESTPRKEWLPAPPPTHQRYTHALWQHLWGFLERRFLQWHFIRYIALLAGRRISCHTLSIRTSFNIRETSQRSYQGPPWPSSSCSSQEN